MFVAFVLTNEPTD